MPEALFLAVGLDEPHLLLGAPGEPQVRQRFVVDREDRAGRSVLRRHVADRRAVRKRNRRDAGTVELDELADDAVLAQHLRDREDEVGRRRALGQLAGELEADDARDQHRHRLTEHRRLGLDSTDAPAEYAEAVDHRGVRVGPDERVRISKALPVGVAALEHRPRQVFEVDLMHDAGVRWHDGEVLERLLAPTKELVALLVAVELQRSVLLECVRCAEDVDYHRVVDDELGRDKWVDLLGVTAECRHRFAHGREVDDTRNAGEVLHDDACRCELDLRVWLGIRLPSG